MDGISIHNLADAAREIVRLQEENKRLMERVAELEKRLGLRDGNPDRAVMIDRGRAI